jgi:Na+-driven multidrug efflux pump
VALAAPLIPTAFSSDPAVRSQVAVGVLVLAVALLPGAAAFALDGILIGAGEYRALSAAMVISLAVFVVAIVPVMVVGTWGLAGVWGAITVWMTVRAVLTWRVWSRA